MNLCLCGVLIGLNNTMFRAKQDNNVVPFNNSYDLFQEVYNEQVDSLYAFVLKKVKNPELAQDIVQDTFLKFWDNRNALNPEANLQAYLFTIAHHLIIDAFRKEVKEITIDQYVSLYGAINENKTADSDIIYKDVLQYVESSKTKLPSRACEIYKMSRDKGMTIKEISQNLSLSPQTVKNYLTTVLKVLRKELTKGGFICWLLSFLFEF